MQPPLIAPSSPPWWPLRASLPREARDTLFLLATIAGVVGLLAPHLPWWCWLMTMGVLGWRALGSWRGWPLPSRAWRLLLPTIAAAATLATHRTLLGQEAGVTLIVVMLALKTLELRARRDAFVVFFLGMFTLLTHFFYSQSLLTALGVLLATWGLLTSLVLAHMPLGYPSLREAAATAARMAVLGAPLMLVLFLLFPRLSPLWGLPSEGSLGRSGLSSSMEVGRVAELALNTDIAFRVRFQGSAPPSHQLYFRGPVLSRFDGRTWQRGVSLWPAGQTLATELRVQGPAIAYEITAEPSNRPWLLTLEATPEPPELPDWALRMAPDLSWSTDRPLTDLIRYRARAYPDFAHGPTQALLGLQDHVELPPGFNPRTLELAQQWRRQEPPGPQASHRLIERALTQLRTGGYTYTLAPGVYGMHTADEFWFDRKEGFCEHIASAFVVLMRAMDIPARIVTGYQGGEINPVDGLLTVRQSDAHAWAEVWLAGQGWVRIDPTASVAPARIQGAARLAAPPGLVAGTLHRIDPALLQQLRNAWEALNTRWNTWVLNYGRTRQTDLLARLGLTATDWRDLAALLAGLLGAAAAVGLAWAAWSRHRQRDPWLRLLERARRAARRSGLRPPAHATPRQIAELLRPHPACAPTAQWLLELEALRYAPTPPAHAWRALGQRWPSLPWPRRPA